MAYTRFSGGMTLKMRQSGVGVLCVRKTQRQIVRVSVILF